MSQWRTRGYVQDSDEEDEYDSQGTPALPPATEDNPTDASNLENATNHEPCGTSQDKTLTKIQESSEDELAQEDLKSTGRHSVNPSARIFDPSAASEAQPEGQIRDGKVHMTEAEDSGLGIVRAPAASQSSHTSETEVRRTDNAGTQDRLSTRGTFQSSSQRPPTSASCGRKLIRADSPAEAIDDVDELQDDWQALPTEGQMSSLPAHDRPESLAEMLSSPPDIRETEFSLRARLEGSPRPRQTVQAVISRPERPVSISPEEENVNEAESVRIGRALRKRNPIQLHPYLLEGEKYRQSLRARGLKPVKVAAQQARHQHNEGHRNEGQNTQDRNFVVDHTQSSSLHGSSQTAMPSSPPPNLSMRSPHNDSTAPAQDGNDSSDSDVFPDLSVLVQRKYSGAVQQGAKRRKIAQTSSRKNGDSRNDPEQPRIFLGADDADLRVFDIPPSPPPSRTPPVPVLPQVQSRLRVLRSPSPLQPPTPAVSSSTRVPIRRRVVRSDSENESHQRTMRPRSNHSDISATSSESENDGKERIKEAQFRRLQKRIKGVLPASWLRLDYQAQAENERQQDPTPRRKPVLSRTPSVRIGVTVTNVRSDHTRHQSTARESVGIADQARTVDLFSDESENEMPVVNALTQGAQNEYEPEIEFEDNLVSQGAFEVPEHDWIDPMLPSGPRNRNPDKPKRKKQTRLTDTLYSRKRLRLDKSETSSRPAGWRVSSSRKAGERWNRARAAQSRAPKTPRLSVLDAPGFQSSEINKLPAFLRVAARQVRHCPDKGRRSPKSKQIRLQTAADTEDANHVLREWRAGTIRPSTQPDFRERAQDNFELTNAEQRIHQQRLPAPESLNHGPSDHRPRIEEGGDASPQQRTRRGIRQMQLKPTHLLLQPGGSTIRGQDAQKRKGQYFKASIPALKQPEYRTAQLEGLENEYDRRHRAAAFHKNLSKLNRNFVDGLRSKGTVANPRLSKFLEDKDEVAPLPIFQSHPGKAQDLNDTRLNHELDRPMPARPLRKGRVKRPAQRLDTEAREYRQPSEPLPLSLDDQPTVIEAECVETDRLEGLGPHGTRYTTDFDVLPLSMGTFFHESTFIGGGELKAALDLKNRDLNTPTRTHVFTFNGKLYRWSAWTDEVSSDLGSLWSTVITRHGQRQNPALDGSQKDSPVVDCLCVLRSVLRFVAADLYFLDPVDSRSFVLHMSNLLEMASAKFLPDMATSRVPPSGQITQNMTMRATMFMSLIAFQTLQIAESTTVDSSIKKELELLFKNVMSSLLRSVLKHDMGDLRKYLEDNRRHLIRERGIHEDSFAIEAVVVSAHVLESAKIPQFLFWDLVREELLPPIQSSRHVATFERAWYDIFTLLPYFEFDNIGVLRAGRRYQAVQGDWSIVIPLLNQILKLYPGTLHKPGISVNGYIRSCLCRCHCLVQNWNWRRCEPMLTTIFDFFSHRGFGNLQNEQSKGSARFLNMLNRHPSLVIQPDDRTFHVFLKTLAVGLKALRGVYNEKQIRNVSWRLVPNHRRSYRKEEALHQQDLEGLRNQHDLLCTLYWATPSSSRAGLKFLRSLVDQTASHREVCRLSVKAWSVLARFQISTDEGSSALEPFSDWFMDIIRQNLAQHRLARSEAESQYEAMKFQGHDHISPQHLQLTIKTNQAQILATILDAVVGLKMAISAAHDVEIATEFLKNSAIWDVFKLFDAKSANVISLMVEVVEVYQAFMQILQDKDNEGSEESQQPTEDSQDYGEWPGLEDEELIPRQAERSSGPSLDFLQDSLWQLISTCFGSDVPPDDRLLTKGVEAWTKLAGRLVRTGKKEWDTYLDLYGANSWRQLQDTDQTRKYGPYFMALVMEQNSTSYEQHRQDFLTSWLLSLVERESMLKFQHRFTSALVNTDPEHVLLGNLPFLKVLGSRVDIKLSELRERRLSLISTVLSNMRDAYDEATQAGQGDLLGLRREFGHLLKQLMNAMRKNYQELQREISVKGSYVSFVQSVVEFLQQYTSEICPIDKFFTDSSVFPLPATDPTYVVGRLKSYTYKLSNSSTLKQLVTFIKTVTERAAFDTQQPYLVSQLHVAVSNSFEHGPTTTVQPSYIPTLRHVLLRAIFPAYITQSISQNGSIASFLFSVPILEATALFFADLPMSFSATDLRSCTVATAMLAASLDAVLAGPFALLTTRPRLLELPHVLRTMALLLRVAQASVPAAMYIALRTRSSQGADLVGKILNIRRCALCISAILLGANNVNAGIPDVDLVASPDDPGLVVPLPDGHSDARTEQDEQDRQQREAHLFADIRHFCEREVRESLDGGEWIRLPSAATAVQQPEEEREDFYVFIRPGNRREVRVSICSVAGGRQEVIKAVEALWAVCEACGIAVDAGLALEAGSMTREELDVGTTRVRHVVFPEEGNEVAII